MRTAALTPSARNATAILAAKRRLEKPLDVSVVVLLADEQRHKLHTEQLHYPRESNLRRLTSSDAFRVELEEKLEKASKTAMRPFDEASWRRAAATVLGESHGTCR